MEHQVRARTDRAGNFVSCGRCGEERKLSMIGWTDQLGAFLAEHAPCQH